MARLQGAQNGSVRHPISGSSELSADKGKVEPCIVGDDGPAGETRGQFANDVCETRGILNIALPDAMNPGGPNGTLRVQQGSPLIDEPSLRIGSDYGNLDNPVL